MLYYTAPEVAIMLRKSKSYVYENIFKGLLQTVRLSERGTRIPASSLEEFLLLRMDTTTKNSYNKAVTQPPKRGRKRNGSI